MASVHLRVLTDPACPWSWGAEPALRRVLSEFGDALRVTYVMGGLAREFRRPHETAAHWLDAAAATGMPSDPRMWLGREHPRSSYPACLAVKAAAEQGLDRPYLRRAREGLACEGRRLDGTEALVDLARGVPGLDLERFRIDLGSNAIVERFGADHELVRTRSPEHHNEHGRLPFPSFEAEAEDGAVHGAYGTVDAGALRAAVVAAGARPVREDRPGVEEALRDFGRMATAEVAAVCDLPGPRAAAELWRLAVDWRVRTVGSTLAPLWEPAAGSSA